MNKPIQVSIPLLCALILLTGAVSGQQTTETHMPMAMERANAGSEFYFLFPPCYEQGANNNQLKIFVSSAVATEVTLAVERYGYKQTKTTVPFGTIEFNIAPGIGQPFVKPSDADAPVDSVYRGAAIRVTAGAPVVLSGLTKFQYTGDGFLALPVSALGTDYILASYPDIGAMYTQAGLRLPSEVTICAAFDNTEISFTMGGNAVSQTAGGQTPGETTRWSLNKGDVLSINTRGFESDLSGSRVVSNYPVAVVSGNQCANVPTNMRWCDYICDFEKPVDQWGKVYHVHRSIKRKTMPWLRVFAAEPDTRIYRDGNLLKNVGEITGLQGESWFDVEFSITDNDATVISADKPIRVTYYNPGQEVDNQSADPFMTHLIPAEQYGNSIWYGTPGLRNGEGHPENYFNLLYQNDGDNIFPAYIEIGIVQDGKVQWRRLRDVFGSIPGEEFFSGPNQEHYYCKTLQLPGDGVYLFRSEKKIAALAYGRDNFDTYGFMATTRNRTLSADETRPPEIITTYDCQTGEFRGHAMDPGPETEQSRLAAINLIADVSYNMILEVEDFIPAFTAATDWSVKPVDGSKAAKAVVAFIDAAGNAKIVTLEHSATGKGIVRNTEYFGVMPPGEVRNRTVRIENYSATEPYVVESIEIDSAAEGYRIANMPSLPLTLAPNSGGNDDYYYDIHIVFSGNGRAEQLFNGVLKVSSECFDYIVDLEARTAFPIIHVGDVDFGTVTIGTAHSQKVSVRNRSQNAALTITEINGPHTGEFSVEYPVGFELPYIIAPEATLDVMVQYSATKDNVHEDRIEFVNNADNNNEKHICILTGRSVIATDMPEEAVPPGVIQALSPNPATVYTELSYTLQTEAPVSISIVDNLGRLVLERDEGIQPAGQHTITLDLKNITPGGYTVRCRAANVLQSYRFVIHR